MPRSIASVAAELLLIEFAEARLNARKKRLEAKVAHDKVQELKKKLKELKAKAEQNDQEKQETGE